MKIRNLEAIPTSNIDSRLPNNRELMQKVNELIDAHNESQEPKALEEHGEEYIKGCECDKCFRNAITRLKEFMEFGEAKPQDEPKECCELCECASYVDGVKTESKCNSKDCPCHQESETGWREDLAISHLRIVLPMAKAYAASSDVGSNREFVEAADIFLKSLEK